jgi:hypothetical protein
LYFIIAALSVSFVAISDRLFDLYRTAISQASRHKPRLATVSFPDLIQIKTSANAPREISYWGN